MAGKESNQINTSPDLAGKVGYSILTPAFYDSNDDGIGDIPGVTQKLDYLQDLGIDIIHLTPFYKTHLYDIGYDVDDYESVDPRYGTRDSLKTFIDESHKRDIRVVTDMVVNHTSIHHKWFEEARSSRDNPKRDWYIWRDPQSDGSPPNNWAANFGGDAWEYDEKTGQYFLHTFLPEQPDLNYENPAVRKEMLSIMSRWAEFGVDGFRLDSVNFIRKAQGLPDGIPNNEYVHGVSHPNTRVSNPHWWYQEEMLEDLHAFTKDSGTFIFSESNPPESLKVWREKIYRSAQSENHAMINSTLNGMQWNAETVVSHLEEFYGMLEPEDIASYQTSCHDVYQRTVDRIGEEQARNAALLNLSLPGIPWLYYGDEIGMHGMHVPYDFENPFQNLTFMRFGYDRTKNPSRLSMAWDDHEHAGFSKNTPVLPVHTDYVTHNVKTELRDPHSPLHLHKNLLSYRKQSEALKKGRFERTDAHNNDVGAYILESQSGEKNGVVINFSNEKQTISLNVASVVVQIASQFDIQEGEVIDLTHFEMLPHQGILFSPRQT